ncbi:TPA: arginase family protein, partial [Streptococcus equi subsp. zooepidemicus]|nr:arginase family protein [Streptococcus equi subsp. zooepidemicus]
MLTNYYPMTYSYYQGSIEDNPYTAKWGMVTKFLDLNDETLTPFEGMTFGIIGFKSDKGVYINNGRVGAVEGPTAIRSQIAKLPWHWGTNVTVYDVGNIDGPNHSLEELQESLSQAIQRMYQLGIQPIVLGGGHGTAYGHYLGIQS